MPSAYLNTGLIRSGTVELMRRAVIESSMPNRNCRFEILGFISLGRDPLSDLFCDSGELAGADRPQRSVANHAVGLRQFGLNRMYSWPDRMQECTDSFGAGISL
jgi:hypothetical protein